MVVDIEDPFIQQQGTIYWLAIQVNTARPIYYTGWKTTENHWNDNAVWSDGVDWHELWDPALPQPPDPGAQSLDLAFVITTTIPEPTLIIWTLLLTCSRGTTSSTPPTIRHSLP